MLKAKEERQMALEERVACIEGILGQMDKRLTNVETAVSNLRDKIDQKFEIANEKSDQFKTEINEKFDQLKSEIVRNNRWLIGIIIATWITTILTVLYR
ncbi:hypothetical protein H0A61_02939 [Koleobacter methoxysyntrophicus]|jgi:uncharacterized coiled-coil protein SlyX|uniref:Hemolysin XhlA n=1 Tax=Koleobacter methoxysyntrophicus TaxID=2751313 RepID=A0A8A0RQ80_9FIRM|nr:hypothetical protein [Koleobacter methoxysyntrophicus]QSQ10531.1 hypothetical protein H0A61_02939 [Koleobacter methoxysyntrophicus]